MMQAEELFQAIGYIDDTLILRSDRKKKKKNWFAIYGGVMVSAACLALLFGTNYMMNRPITDGPQPSITSQPSQSGDGNGPDYYDPSATPIPEDYWTEPESPNDYGMMPELGWVDFNPGPIMPLTLAEEMEGITAERELLYDFSAVSKEDKGYVPIKDSYVLTNTVNKDETVTIYYPYVTDVRELNTYLPQLTVDGVVRETTILNGAYMGEDNEGMPRLFGPTVSTDEYSSMLKKVKPLSGASDEELMKQKVWAYELEDWDSQNVPPNIATYAVKFKVDAPGKVYTAHSYTTEYDGEYLQVSFNLSTLLTEQTNAAVYFLGEAPTEYIEQGYSYVDITDENKSDKVTAKMKIYETTIEDVLRAQMDVQLKKLEKDDDRPSEKLMDLYYERMERMFNDMYLWANDGVNTPEDQVFYENSISDIAYMAWDYDSVYLLSETFTIPADSSVKVDFDYKKPGACNTYEPREEFRDNYCYDNMPNLLTNLEFTKQTAAILESGNIRIENQNYGFDLEKSIKKVPLELDAERYYMIVKMLK